MAANTNARPRPPVPPPASAGQVACGAPAGSPTVKGEELSLRALLDGLLGRDAIVDDFDAELAAAGLDGVPAGPLAAQLLGALDPWREGLPPRALLSVVMAGERLSSWAQVQVVRATARFAQPGVGVPVQQVMTAIRHGEGGHTVLARQCVQVLPSPADVPDDGVNGTVFGAAWECGAPVRDAVLASPAAAHPGAQAAAAGEAHGCGAHDEDAGEAGANHAGADHAGADHAGANHAGANHAGANDAEEGGWANFGEVRWCTAAELAADPVWGPALCGEAERLAAAELAVALTLSPVTAGIRISQAQAFTQDLAATLDAWGSGSIDRPRAARILDATRDLDPDCRRQVEATVLPRAGTMTPGRAGQLADKTALAADPAAAQRRHQRRTAERGVSVRALGDGMARLAADLTSDKAALSYAIIDAYARHAAEDGDDRGIGARRADVLVDLIGNASHSGGLLAHQAPGTTAGPASGSGAPDGTPGGTVADRGPSGDTSPARHEPSADTGTAGHPSPGGTARPDHSPSGDSGTAGHPSPGGADCAGQRPADGGHRIGPSGETNPPRRPSGSPAVELQIVIAASTLAHLDDQPGMLAGIGGLQVIPADVARALAKSATKIRALIQTPWATTQTAPDPGSRCGQHGCAGDATFDTRLAIGPAIYRPTAALRDYVITRDRTCRWPGCRRTAEACDLDHRIPFDSGGATCPCNLQTLCRRHHRVKTFANWQSRAVGTTVHWTTPHGLHATAPPEPLPQDDTAAWQRLAPGQRATGGSTGPPPRTATPAAGRQPPPSPPRTQPTTPNDDPHSDRRTDQSTTDHGIGPTAGSG